MSAAALAVTLLFAGDGPATIAGLFSPDRAVRVAAAHALHDVLDIGPAGRDLAPLLLERIAAPETTRRSRNYMDTSEEDLLAGAVARMGADAVPAVRAALTSDDPDLRAAAGFVRDRLVGRWSELPEERAVAAALFVDEPDPAADPAGEPVEVLRDRLTNAASAWDRAAATFALAARRRDAGPTPDDAATVAALCGVLTDRRFYPVQVSISLYDQAPVAAAAAEALLAFPEHADRSAAAAVRALESLVPPARGRCGGPTRSPRWRPSRRRTPPPRGRPSVGSGLGCSSRTGNRTRTATGRTA